MEPWWPWEPEESANRPAEAQSPRQGRDLPREPSASDPTGVNRDQLASPVRRANEEGAAASVSAPNRPVVDERPMAHDDDTSGTPIWPRRRRRPTPQPPRPWL